MSFGLRYAEKKMRVLIAVERFHEDVRGGAYRIAADCAYELRDRGHQVTLLCAGLHGAPAVEERDGVRILRYQMGRGLTRTQRHFHPIRRLLQRESAPDLVWGHTPNQFVAAFLAFTSARCAYAAHSPAPLEVLNAHHPPKVIDRVKARLATGVERACLEHAAVIQTLSQFTRTTLLDLHGGRYAPKMFVTPGWADTDLFQPVADKLSLKRALGWRTDVPCLFTLRRLVPRMGIDTLIEAAANVRDQGSAFHLYIGGEGPQRQELASRIERLRLTESVTLLGAVPQSQLPVAYAACDVFLIPTRALECFGLIAVEALSCGVPVLATTVGALGEVVGAFEPAWMMKPDAASVAAAISSYLRAQLPQHAPEEMRAYVLERYGKQVALRRFCDIALSAA